MKKSGGISGMIFVIILCVFSFGACGSLPPLPSNQAEVWSVLPQNSEFFISLQNTEENQFLWKRFTSSYASENKRVAEALTQTRGLSLAVRAEGTIRRNYLILQGRFPGCWINWGLWWDSAWKEIATQWGPYWQEKSGKLKIKIIGDQLLMISTGSMQELLEELACFSEKKTEFPLKQSILSSPLFVYFPFFTKSNFSEQVPINQKRLPVDEVWLRMTLVEKLYNIESQFSLRSEEDAMLFSRSFKTFLLWFRGEALIENFVKRAEVGIDENLVSLLLKGFDEDEIGRGIEVFQKDELFSIELN